jgi:hypothetical protein
MSNGELARVLRTSSRTIERVISRLRTAGIIENVGTGKNDRSLKLTTDTMSALTTGIMSGTNTDTTSGALPTSGVVTTDMTADHNIKKRNRKSSADTSFAFVLRTGKDWKLPQAKLDEYKEAFPRLDVEAELLKAGQWLNDNPSRRKTANGMPRFLGGWLGRAKPDDEQQAIPEATAEQIEAAFQEVVI